MWEAMGLREREGKMHPPCWSLLTMVLETRSLRDTGAQAQSLVATWWPLQVAS